MPEQSQIFDKNSANQKTVLPVSFDVHTMPAKFLAVRPSFSGQAKSSGATAGFKKNIIIGAMMVIVIGAAMALAAWLFLKSVKKEVPAPATNAPATNNAPASLNQEPINIAPTTTDESALQVLLDVSQWQPYIKATDNYSLKYPTPWQLASAASETAPNALSRISIAGETGLGQIYITVYNNSERATLLSWLTQNFGLSEVDLESYKLNNNDGYRSDDIAANSFTIATLYGGKFYILEFIKSKRVVVDDIYEQFLINWQFIPLAETEEETEENINYEPVIDSDQDGLTDAEEALFGTDKSNPDTDGDTYSDGVEVINLYNPKIAGSARLYESDLVKTQVNNFHHYNLVYPASWQVKETQGSVIFQDAQGEFFQVLIEPNSQGYVDIKKWYKDYLKLDPTTVTDTVVAGATPAIVSADQMHLYFIFGDNIYSLIYNINLRQNGNFMTTFKMIVKSFKLMSSE